MNVSSPTGLETAPNQRNSSSAAAGWGLVGCGVACVVLTAFAARAVGHYELGSFAGLALACGALYLVAVWLVLRRPARGWDFAVILIIALSMRGVALIPAPNLSTDAFRYVWDGRMQAAGFNPYLHVPADPALAHLRDTEIYPHINQKERAVTIYPPAAELLFRAMQWIGDDLGAVRATMTLFDLATLVLLFLLLKRLKLARERIIIYAWNPLPVWEFVCQGHIDAAVTTAIAAGLLAAAHGRQMLTGAIFAVAALLKYFPVVLLPAIWRRWDWRLPVAFAVVAGLLYLPYVREAGVGVLGFLATHLNNEGYGAGWGFHPIWILRDFHLADPPARAYVAFSAIAMGALAIHALLHRAADELRFERMVLLGAVFVWLASPHYPWYFAFLPAMLVAAPNPAVILMSVTSVALYMPRTPGGFTWTGIYLIVYWLPFAVLIGQSLWPILRKQRA